MVQIWFPGLRFNGLTIKRGILLNVSLMGIGLVIPPFDLPILPAMTFWEPFLAFDSDWIVAPIASAVENIPKMIVDFIRGILEAETEEYYKRHPERRPK